MRANEFPTFPPLNPLEAEALVGDDDLDLLFPFELWLPERPVERFLAPFRPLLAGLVDILDTF